MKFYSCQFAPCGANVRDVIRVAQLVHDRGVSAYEAVAPDAFHGRWTDAAILINHDPKRRAGTVTVVAAHKDWMLADFVLDGPHAARAAELIERSGSVSPGFTWIERDPIFAKPITPDHHPTHWYTAARLDEISLVEPGAIGWYSGAKVTHAYKPTARTPTVTKEQPLAVRELGRRYADRDLIIDRSDGSQEIHHGARRSSPASESTALQPGEVLLMGGAVISRPCGGKVLGIR